MRTATGNEPTGALIGMTRDEVREALATPRTCERDDVGEQDGGRRLVAPCRWVGDWLYSFYHLPSGSFGGGPELLLRFDDADRCWSAAWQFTR